MFPNVRLLIAALLATVFALSCGFGVFAALGVSREPLGRLTAGAATLQLAANEAAAAAATWGAPFGAGVHVSETRTGVAVADAQTIAPVQPVSPPHAPHSWAAAAMKASVAGASPMNSPTPISAATPAQPAPSAAEPATTAAAIPAAPSAPPAPLAATASATATETPSVKSQVLDRAPDVVTKVAGEERAPAPATAPAVAAVEPAANAAPSGAQSADLTGAIPAVTAPEEITPARVMRRLVRTAPPRHVVKRRLVRPAASAAAAPAFQATVFQSAPATLARPPAARRRTIKKTASSATPANSSAWPNAR